MMSGTLAALTPTNSSDTKSAELRAHCERLIIRLQDPYFRTLLTFLAVKDWSEVLEEELLPLRERLAIALQFLEDDAVSAYLRRLTERALAHGDIEGIVLTGLTVGGMAVLQSYVDRTGDVQTVAILAAYVHPHKVRDRRAECWLETYRDLLDSWRLFHFRCQFDIERGQMLQDLIQNGDTESVNITQKQILMRCNYCNKIMSAPPEVSNSTGRVSRTGLKMS